MTVVFVHGVPETAAVWDRLMAAVGSDGAVALGLPGFGRPMPPDFEPTMDRYADWLADELRAFDTVDLVAHDWGALLALRVLADRPVNVRSWVLDAGDLDDDFRWHSMARTWQTPGEGEAFMEAFVAASSQDRAALLVEVGVPATDAVAMADAIDATMGEAILVLYRSATAIGPQWGPGIDQITGPGLLIESALDPFRDPRRVAQLATRTGAEVAELPDCGHFWMLEQPDEVATRLRAFWDALAAAPGSVTD